MAHNERPDGCPDEIDAKEQYGGNWPSDKPFPLTPMEAWYVLQGYSVRPRNAQITVEMLDDLPGKLELSNGYLMLWRS